LTCLVPPVDPPLPADYDERPRCAWMDLDLAARVQQSWPLVGVSREILLTRARAEVGGSRDGVGARLVTGVARSGGTEGYIGIDGESLVPVVQVAEARIDVPDYGLRFAGGVLDDPWIVPGEQAWRLPASGKVLADQNGWMDRSDLAGRFAVSVPRVSASLTFGTGEGFRRRERNNGKSLTAVATVRPLLDRPDILAISVLGRDGSRGLATVRDHRLGLRVTSTGALGTTGLELLAAWGVDADAGRTPIGASAWGVVDGQSPWYAFGRLDVVQEAPGQSASLWTLGRLGAGRRFAETGRISVGAEVGHKGPEAAAIAGSDASAGWLAVYAQVEVRMRGAVDLTE
jgi:hypothetical protein